MKLEITKATGPDYAPAAAVGVGALGRHCVRYQAPGTVTGLVTARLTCDHLPDIADIVGQKILPGQMLEWCVFPGFDSEAVNIEDGFRATGTAIDLIFDDDTSLLSITPRDLTGLSTDPGNRQDIDIPDQWNHRRIGLDSAVGRTVTQVVAVLDAGTPRDAVSANLRGWIEAPRIVAAPSLMGPDVNLAVNRVLTTRGTHSSPWRSRGNTVPAVATPHGAISLTPATSLENTHWNYSWNAHSNGSGPALAGLLISRSPSIWIGDRGALAIRIGKSLDETGLPRAEPFDHAQELARPHIYRVITESGITTSGSSDNSSAIIEIDFPAAGWIAVTGVGESAFTARVSPLAAHKCDSQRENAGTIATPLHLEINTVCPSPHQTNPLTGYHSVVIESSTPVESAEPITANATASQPILLRLSEAGRVRIRIGTSLLNSEQAQIIRELELGDATVAEVAVRNAASWEPLLTMVQAPTASADQQVALASDLYRLYLFPSRHDEDLPEGRGYFNPYGPEPRAGKMYTNNGFWDTYRTCWPAYTLLSPQRAGQLLDGMLEHVRASGWSPRWTAGSALDAMVGTNLDVIAADLAASGVNNFDMQVAYEAALRNSSSVSVQSEFGRKGMPSAQFRGYVSAEVPESVSWTLEGAICDAATAVLARAMIDRVIANQTHLDLDRASHATTLARLQAEARWLTSRAGDHRLLFDNETKFYRPREPQEGNAEGLPKAMEDNPVWADEPFDPRIWGGAHTETNAWGSRFAALHDGPGLLRQFGGPAGLRAALDDYFAEPETGRAEFSGSYGEIIHEMPEARDIRRGMWAPSNQPAHHVAWLYAWTDEPWHTQRILQDAVDRLFLGMHIGQGYPGDEDNGEMSAWRLFAVLGLAPFQPGSGELLLTAPQLPEILISPEGAPPIRISVTRQQDSDCYIQRVLVDGVEWEKPTISVARLHEGAHLSFELGATPVRWCTPLTSSPYFYPPDYANTDRPMQLEDRTVQVLTSDGIYLPDVIDNEGAVGVPIAPGASWLIMLNQKHLIAVSALLTLSLQNTGCHGFTIACGVGNADWTTVATFTQESWDWPAQTRPFTVPLTAGCDRIKLMWHHGSAVVHQVQLLTPSA